MIAEVEIWGDTKRIDVDEAVRAYPYLWEEIDRLFPELSPQDRATIVELMINTCSSCHDSGRGCVCCRDE